MQIFATSPDPKLAAQWLDDRRLNKMVTESAQIICTILSDDGIRGLPFKPTHAAHPVVKWAGYHESNLRWLVNHHIALDEEWALRFDKIHASGLNKKHLASVRIMQPPKTFQNSASNGELGLNFTWVDDVHLAYRFYLTARWLNSSSKPKWTKRKQPVWYDYPFVYNDAETLLLIKRAQELIGVAHEGSISCPRCGRRLKYKNRHNFKCTSQDYPCLTWIKL